MPKKTIQDISIILDERFKDFREVIKRDMVQTFNQGFEEIVMPNIERLDTKINRVENRLEQIDRKLDVVSAKSFDNEAKLKNHDLRIQKVEKILATS